MIIKMIDLNPNQEPNSQAAFKNNKLNLQVPSVLWILIVRSLSLLSV